MREIRTLRSMSGEGKRGRQRRNPRPSSTLPETLGAGVSKDWGCDDTGGTVGRVDSRPGERGCDGCCG